MLLPGSSVSEHLEVALWGRGVFPAGADSYYCLCTCHFLHIICSTWLGLPSRAGLTSLLPDNRCSVFLEQTEVLFRLRGRGRKEEREEKKEELCLEQPCLGSPSKMEHTGSISLFQSLPSRPCTPNLVPPRSLWTQYHPEIDYLCTIEYFFYQVYMKCKYIWYTLCVHACFHCLNLI